MKTIPDLNIKPAILHPPLKRDDTLKLLNQLTLADAMEMCIIQHWSVPGIYPLIFGRLSISGNILFETYTANKRSKELLKMFLIEKGSIIIPRIIIIRDTESNTESMLSGSMLLPHSHSNFVTTTHLQTFVVTLSHGPVGGATPSVPGDGGGSDGSDDSGGSDDDGGTSSDDGSSSSTSASTDSSDSSAIVFALLPNPFRNTASINDVLHLLPPNFQPGVDSQGNVGLFF